MYVIEVWMPAEQWKIIHRCRVTTGLHRCSATTHSLHHLFTPPTYHLLLFSLSTSRTEWHLKAALAMCDPRCTRFMWNRLWQLPNAAHHHHNPEPLCVNVEGEMENTSFTRQILSSGMSSYVHTQTHACTGTEQKHTHTHTHTSKTHTHTHRNRDTDTRTNKHRLPTEPWEGVRFKSWARSGAHGQTDKGWKKFTDKPSIKHLSECIILKARVGNLFQKHILTNVLEFCLYPASINKSALKE